MFHLLRDVDSARVKLAGSVFLQVGWIVGSTWTGRALFWQMSMADFYILNHDMTCKGRSMGRERVVSGCGGQDEESSVHGHCRAV